MTSSSHLKKLEPKTTLQIATLKAGLQDQLNPNSEAIIQSSIQSLANRMDAIIASINHNLESSHNQFDKIAIPVSGGANLVPSNEIIYMRADSNYTEIYMTDGSKKLISRTLKSMSANLPPYFFRAHKSYVVNLNFVSGFRNGQQSILSLDNGDPVPVSRTRKLALKQQLGIVD